MKRFKYKARSEGGKAVKGILFAEDRTHLSVLLQERDLFLLSCKEISNGKRETRTLFSRVSLGEISLFCRQFSIMLNSGVPVAECLEALCQQSYSGELQRVVASVYRDVLEGKSLDKAFAAHPRVFSPYFASMVRLGAESGALPDVMNSCASYFENQERVRRRLSSALAYPAFLLVMLAVVCVCVVGFVIPAFKDAIDELGVRDIPPVTKAVFAVSGFLQSNGGFILLIALGVIALIVIISLTDRGRMLAHRALMSLPLIKSVSVNTVCAGFARSVCLLLANGTDILEALRGGAFGVKNRYAQKRIYDAVEELKKGKSAVNALRSSEIFPDIFIQMVSVGEKSGSLCEVMEKCALYYESRAEASTNRILSVIQPALLIVVGLIIALVFLSVYSPIMGLMNGI